MTQDDSDRGGNFSRIFRKALDNLFDRPEEEPFPESFGKYAVVDKIGTGGMGAVYRARHPKLETDVAIKVLSAVDEGDDKARERLHHEAKVLAAVQHQNIVHVYDYGADDDDVPYIVMEFVEGETLADKISRGPLPPEEALQILRGTIAGLKAAWEKSVVHRDVKPSNILLDHADWVRVCDFGLAKPVVFNQASATTQSGVVPGTPQYISPEQARGKEVDFRADIYSLGIVLFEMLTGEPPFTGSAAGELVAKHIHDPLPTLELPASAAPDELAALVEWMTFKNAEDRPASYKILREQVDNLYAIEHRAASDLSSTLLVQRAATADAKRDMAVAVLPFDDLSPEGDQQYFCDGIVDELITTLAAADRLKVASRTSSFQFKESHKDPRTIARALNVATVVEGSLKRDGDALRANVSMIDAASGDTLWAERFSGDRNEVFAFQDRIAEAVARRLEVDIGPDGSGPAQQTDDLDAYELHLKGRFYKQERTEASLARSIEYFRDAISRDPAYARAHAELAEALVLLTTYGAEAPTTVMPEAQQAAAEAARLDADLAEARTVLGSISALYDWSWKAAEEHFLEALELSGDNSLVHHSYALSCLIPQARFDEALEHIHKARTLEPFSAPISASLGMYRYFSRDYDAAVEALRETLKENPKFAFAHLFLGQTYTELGDHVAAAGALRDAVALSDRAPEHVAAIGYGSARAGDEEAAHRTLAELDKLAARRFVPSSYPARVYAALGDTDRALAGIHGAVEEKSADLAWLAVRPVFDSLRGAEGFGAVLDRLHLVPPPKDQ